MSIAAPMLVISLIIYAGLFGLFIYLVILIIRALKKYIRSKDVRAEKSVLKQNLGEVLKDLRTKNKRRKAYMIYSKYDVMKRCISEMNFPDYRYEQLIKMIFAQHVSDFHAMYMLPERLRANLAETFGASACGLVPIAHQASGQADKVLFQLKDGNCVETVNLHYKKGWESFCISSQCGCGFGCKFCATGAIGHKRNMTADEITDQILYFYLAGHKMNSVSFRFYVKCWGRTHKMRS